MSFFASLFRIVLFCVGVLLLSHAYADSDAAPPTPNLTTPENALETYWQLHDWYTRGYRTEVSKGGAHATHQTFRTKMEEVTTGETKKYFSNIAISPPTQLSRTIKSKIESSATQVTIIANIKNSTPIPAGVSPSARQFAEREAGQDFKYILKKIDNDWKILEVWHLSTPGINIPGLPNIPKGIYQMYKDAPDLTYPSAVYGD